MRIKGYIMAKNSFVAEITFKGCKKQIVLLGDEQKSGKGKDWTPLTTRFDVIKDFPYHSL